MEKSPRREFLVFGQPQILEPEIDEVVDSMRHAWLGTGPKVARFNRECAAHKGAPHVTAGNSCTAGLDLSCIAAGVKPGEEDINTARTIYATVNARIHSTA